MPLFTRPSPLLACCLLVTSLLLAACGGGSATPDEPSTPLPQAKAIGKAAKASTVRQLASAGSISSPGYTAAQGTVLKLYQALLGYAPDAPTFQSATTSATASPAALAATLAAKVSGLTDIALSQQVLKNLSVTPATMGPAPYQALQGLVAQLLAAYGPSGRGAVVLNLANALAGLGNDATYGTAATLFNEQLAAAYTYSADSSHTSPLIVSSPRRLNAYIACYVQSPFMYTEDYCLAYADTLIAGGTAAAANQAGAFAAGSNVGDVGIASKPTATGTPLMVKASANTVALSAADQPGDPSTTATLLVGHNLSGAIDTGSDADWYAITLTAGQAYFVYVTGTSGISSLTLADPVLRVLDSTGKQLAYSNDLSNGYRDPAVHFKAPATGIYYLSVESYGGATGTYQVAAVTESADPAYYTPYVPIYNQAFLTCYDSTPALYNYIYCDAYANSIWGGNTPQAANQAGATAAHSNVGNVGTGQPVSATGTPTGASAAKAVLSPSSLTFLPQDVGTTSGTQTVTLSNSGGSPLVLAGGSNGVYVSLGLGFRFNQVQNTCGDILAAGASCTISVSFTAIADDNLVSAFQLASALGGSPDPIPPQPVQGYLEVRSSSLASSVSIPLKGTDVYHLTPNCAAGQTVQNGKCVAATNVLNGNWRGTWNWAGPGSTGCPASNSGAMSMSLSQSSSTSFSGNMDADGYQYINTATGCTIRGTAPGSGTVTGTIASGKNVTFTIYVTTTAGSQTYYGTGTVENGVLSGTLTRSTGGTGSFKLTKQ